MKHNLEQRLDRLDLELEQLLDELAAQPAEKLERPPGEGKWSALQVMQHLMKSEELSHKYVRKKLSFNPELKKEGASAGFRSWLLKAYLNLPFKFKAPKGVNESAFETGVTFDGLAGRWKQQRRDLREFLGDLPDDLFDKEIYKHPFAGRLSLTGMVDFFDSHFQRHRKQIRKAIEEAD